MPKLRPRAAKYINKINIKKKNRRTTRIGVKRTRLPRSPRFSNEGVMPSTSRLLLGQVDRKL